MKTTGEWRTHLPAVGLVCGLVALSYLLTCYARTAGASGSMALADSDALPVGTILPIRLDDAISLDRAEAGQGIEGTVTQDVPLPNRNKIPIRTKVSGTILKVEKADDRMGVLLSLQFHKIKYRDHVIPMITSLRAMASWQAVRAAHLGFSGADGGTPTGWANTVQVGGDIRYGDGGEVRNTHKQKVGKGVIGGVLVHVRAEPGSRCEGSVNGDDHLQALWVFSADACGVYGWKDIQISHNGNTNPKGVITLSFEKAESKLDADTGMLLRVVAP